MPYRPDSIRYRSNGIILGRRPLGRKTRDAVTGDWSYEAYMTENAFGEYVDARWDGMDAVPDSPNVGPQYGPEGSNQ